MDEPSTAQEKILTDRGLCCGLAARALGLSFADRDVELVEVLKASPEISDPKLLPSPRDCAAALGVGERWASLVVERVGRFMEKAALRGDLSGPCRTFAELPEVARLAPALRKLPRGHTVFIGDSTMEVRHWGADAPFPVLAGAYLESLGVGSFENAGVGGETAKKGLARVDAVIGSQLPVRGVIVFGGNDLALGMTIAEVMGNLAGLIEKFRGVGSSVVVLGLVPAVADRLWWLPTGENRGTGDGYAGFNNALRSLAAERGAQFLDMAAEVEDSDRCTDGMHFTQQGQNKMALLLLRIWAAAG